MPHSSRPARSVPRIAGLILGAAMLWACAGGVLWQAARIAHYHAVRIGGSEASFRDTVLLTPASEAVWIEEDELRLDGRMFDVQRRRKSGQDWVLIGHYDRADDEIFNLLHALFGLQPGEGHKATRVVVFFPEAVLTHVVAIPPAVAQIPRRVYKPAPECGWRNAFVAEPDIPPEVSPTARSGRAPHCAQPDLCKGRLLCGA